MSTPHVELGMYPFSSVAWAWDELWTAVHRRAPWTPDALTRSGDVHARWYDDDCIVTHVCGWPFAALHRDDMHLVGAFSLDLPDADRDAHYRSVLLSAQDRPLADLVGPHVHAVANSADSLSGWHSLRAATVGPGDRWPGTVTFTSAHVDSLRALADGEADLACIDAWSLALIEAEEPGLVADLHRVGRGPRIPTPAVTARRSVDDRHVDELRTAFVDALASPETADARRALRISHFAGAELDAYLATIPLGPST
ncbi:phosphate/phosphite/phosphonate ABC transporter substrate-binding protein [Ilumatobacter sp.]|uniref:phosphate/phosphite/phosphonate ABC transporter substrate-binding protein n=1 Tax=Ilumatobacter sp. TaxID=1967498 RepID=UPI003B51D5A4